MAILPLAMVKCKNTHKEISTSATADSVSTVNRKEIICGAVAAQANNMCDEAIKALVIILNSNYKLNNSSINLTESSQYIDFADLYNSDLELYNKISAAYNSVSELYITYNSSIVSVPYSASSNGATLYDEDTSYIVPVASVWDCFSEDYSPDLSCYGVSLNGINYLCNNGSTYEEALLWYLPLCSISEQKTSP